MNLPAIGVIGYDQLGKRVADALLRQPDMRLEGIFDDDPVRARFIQLRGLPLVAKELATWASECQVVVVCSGNVLPCHVPSVYGPEMSASLHGAGEETTRTRVPCADALALTRLVECLPPVERLFSSCARCTGSGIDHGIARMNSLEPLFELPDEDADIRTLLAGVEPVLIRRTWVPYTQSHVHHLKLDLATPIPRDAALAAFQRSPRIRVAAGAAGLNNTGLLQEYDRDLGRPRGDRPEVFVWEETVATVDRSLFLTIDVNPQATPVPDVIDAVRQLARPSLSPAARQQITNRALGMERDE